jgi:signal transduction histidine kinase
MSLEERQATVRRLLAELLVIGPAALLVASLLGYWVASAALRPVESMRAEAAEISAEAPGRRLSLPASRDELRRLGETLNSTLERLEAALRLERTFVADASHEMRSPIARLKAELELALRRRRTAGELEGTVRSALAEAELLARLSENLLFLARSDHGNLPLRRHDVSVPSLFATVAARFQPAAERDGRTIEIEDVADGGLVGDSSYLEQALSNAVENSLRHGAGTVTLLAVEDAGRLELHVLDQGPGFSDGFLPQAFSRFTREEEARTSPGTGLGLSIIGAIALAHGGSAGAANRQGGGADVWLSLPTEPPPS